MLTDVAMLLSRIGAPCRVLPGRVSLGGPVLKPSWTARGGSSGEEARRRPCTAAHALQDASVIDAAILEAAKDPAIASLAERILEAEMELKGAFEPGKLMPSVRRADRLALEGPAGAPMHEGAHSAALYLAQADSLLPAIYVPHSLQAGKVAKMRQSIMDMKGLLAAKLNGQDLIVNPEAADGEAEKARKLFFEVRRLGYGLGWGSPEKLRARRVDAGISCFLFELQGSLSDRRDEHTWLVANIKYQISKPSLLCFYLTT